jgi:hypothetical protein
MALLRPGQTATAKWMADRLGENLREYDSHSFTDGTTTGHSWSTQTSTARGETSGTNESTTTSKAIGTADNSGTSTNRPERKVVGRGTVGTSKSHTDNETVTTGSTTGTTHQNSITSTNGTNQGGTSSSSTTHTVSKERRLESAVYPSEFLGLPDPATTGIIGGYYIAPSMPPWRADIPLKLFLDRSEAPLKTVPEVCKWEDDERVSRLTSWTNDDFCRLGISPIASGKPFTTDKTAVPNDRALPEHEKLDDENGLSPPSFDF